LLGDVAGVENQFPVGFLEMFALRGRGYGNALKLPIAIIWHNNTGSDSDASIGHQMRICGFEGIRGKRILSISGCSLSKKGHRGWSI
jgi:hypothetical protein